METVGVHPNHQMSYLKGLGENEEVFGKIVEVWTKSLGDMEDENRNLARYFVKLVR